ncbi:MAG: YceI family protein [Bacteroidota bacterium]
MKYFSMFKPVVFFISLAFGQLQAQVTTWKITDDYTIKFAGTKAEGTFSGLSGQIQFDPDKLNDSKFDVELEVATISTGNKTKDKHARGASWFNAQDFPKIYFVSKKIRALQVGFEAIGDLRIKDVKKEVVLSFSYFDEGNKAMFEGEMKVNREEYNIEGNLFSFMVGEEFDVTIQLTASKE